MELLLRLMRPRAAATLAAALLAVWVAMRWGSWARQRLELARHPPAEASGPLSQALRQDVQARESARLRGLHRTVSAEIAKAAERRKGFDAARYQRVADAALTLDTPAFRAVAVERLNRLRLAIPPGREAFIPAADEDDEPPAPETPTSRRARRRR